ncbi:hypothetical protein BRDCF_p1821 [Bacteroidales bacterium CF]|jgi:predicted DNA-binding protein (UPF0251 family)|nr:hypothetical protein BRDCF_p1821 [Bacteroidales bacterium CF]
MARQKLLRKVGNVPSFKVFKPVGQDESVSPVIMYLEEYEAIRLSDYMNLSQVESASVMGVSRPTYARIYDNARKKIAEAFVNGKPVVFEGGKVYFDSSWYHCKNCLCSFNHLNPELPVKKCAFCGSPKVEPYIK